MIIRKVEWRVNISRKVREFLVFNLETGNGEESVSCVLVRRETT